jgi:class 3 adenylate cyclase
VSHLVVVNGYARTVRSDDYPVGVPARVIDRFLSEATTPTGGSVDDLALIAPSLVDDARTRQWWHRATHRAAGPVTAQAMLREGTLKDVRDRLSRITVPTLVMHRRDNALIRVEHGRYLAEHIEGVRYVELEGADHAAWAGDSDAVLDEIERFLGASSGAGIGRRVATLLFTDVVGSTQEAARLGDRRWRERLDGHDATIRDQVERHGGRVVKFTGDGMLADFPSPSLAVAAARDLRAAVDLPVRIGVHAGEVELRGEDVSGLAVHIASRVQAHAHPGEILLSRTVCDLLAGSRLTFIPRGTHALKGVPGEWPLYALGDS